MRVVTVSASYGAGGSIVAPALAERLELPFYDRLLRGPEAGSAVHIIEQLSEEERELAPSGRAVTSLGYVTGGLGMPVPTADDLNPTDEMRRQIDASVHRIAHTTGGVILGRGGVVV